LNHRTFKDLEIPLAACQQDDRFNGSLGKISEEESKQKRDRESSNVGEHHRREVIINDDG
jgi:hypothetical protein